MLKIQFNNAAIPSDQSVAVLVGANQSLGNWANKLDKQTKGQITRAMKSSRFKGAKDQFLPIIAPSGTKVPRILLVGIGDAKDLSVAEVEKIGGRIYHTLSATGEAQVTLLVEAFKGCPISETELACHMAEGAVLRSYRFDKYRTKEKPEQKPSLKRLAIGLSAFQDAKKIFAAREGVLEGTALTRDLVSEPANVLYPESFAEEAKKLSALGVKVSVLGEKEMHKLGMNALLGVGQGSAHESKLVVLEYHGQGKEAPVAFVGKGVCFDSGGLSLKPADSMEEMKWDMGGAGVVAGLIYALAKRKARINAIGILGLVENMPSGTAQRPGDIVASMSGQTIEVLNTDAEGRLVLADALWYVQEKFKPKAIIDLATLTGAIIVALGYEHAGLFCNDDELADAIAAAGKATDEKVWRMPMGKAYDRLLNTPSADMKNTGSGRWGGSITAAQFLQRFIKKDTPWAHIDIAGVTWSTSDRPTFAKGATGFGVRLLDRLVKDQYEAASK